MIFKYRFYEGMFLPIIPIKLKGRNECIQSRAYVDTGATYSLFHADVAEILGLELKKGNRKEMVIGDGDTLVVYVHKILVSLAEKEFFASIGFSKGIGIGFNIIGRKDIFDNYIVSFNEKEKQIEFKPN